MQNNETGKIYDIAEIAEPITISTNLSEQPGKLSFNYVENLVLPEGSPIYLKVNNKGMFYGYVFTRERQNHNKQSLVAYDQLYYLKNKDTYVFNTMTAADRFEKICKDKQLKYRVDDRPTYKVPAKVEDNETYYNMIQNAIDQTLIATGNWYMIRDDFGVLQFVSLNRLKTTLVIGDRSLITDYTFKRTIDGDTYNQVKLVKENKETAKREIYIVKDSNNIKKWGLLQYFDKMDEKANEAQIKELANNILKAKNRVIKTLKLKCIGDVSITAGSGVILNISDLEQEGIQQNKYYIVTSCTHTFSNNTHTMELELAVSI